MNELPLFNDTSEVDSIDFKNIISKFLNHWRWFLLGILIALFVSLLRLRYQPTVYSTQATIKILDDQEASGLSFNVSSIFKRSNISLNNEIPVFSSHRIVSQVVKKLALNIKYYKIGRVGVRETFNTPFKVTYKNNIDALKKKLEYEIAFTSKGYRIINLDTEETITTSSFSYQGDSSGFPIKVELAEATTVENYKDQVFTFAINTVDQTIKSLIDKLKIKAFEDDTDLLSISLDYINGKLAQKIINTLITAYEADGITDRQRVSDRTIKFIDDRFISLLAELDAIEERKRKYKTDNNISFIQADAGVSIQNRSMKEQALFNIETQLLLSEILKKNLVNNPAFQLLPANIGIESPTINQLVADYNSTLLEYEKLKTSAGNNNPTVTTLKTNVSELKNNIGVSIKGYIQQLQTTLTQSETAQQIANSDFAALPQKENKLRKIERQQNLKESLYLFLLQKREEASVTSAVTVSNVKVIDYAITNPIPIAPKKAVIVLSTLIIGLLVPFGVIFLIYLLDNKVFDANDILAVNKTTPILMEVPLTRNEADKKELDEIFRTLIHNTLFLRPEKNTQEALSILVTSAIQGEGKTFLSFNMAEGMAKMGKKVVLVGADIRNPKIHRYANISKETLGIVNYVVDKSLDWKSLVIPHTINSNTLDIFQCGPIPPNPTNILMSQRFEELMRELKKNYDYIVFDSAPSLLVSDTLVMAHFADITLFSVRSKVTEKKLIEFSTKLINDQKIKNAAYVINGIDLSKVRYGYKYNYGYGYGYGSRP
jgi:capsular exopolysaccharide synthesis family protein